MHDLRKNDIVLAVTVATEDDANEFVEASATMRHDEKLLHLGNAVKILDARSTCPSHVLKLIQ